MASVFLWTLENDGTLCFARLLRSSTGRGSGGIAPSVYRRQAINFCTSD